MAGCGATGQQDIGNKGTRLVLHLQLSELGGASLCGAYCQPCSQGCIITTLAQSDDPSILIGRELFIPNSNELLKIVTMQTRSLEFRQLLHSKRSTVKTSLAGAMSC